MHTRTRPHPGHTVDPHGSFEGGTARRYDVLARRLMRGLYRRIAEDIAMVAPANGSVLDVGTGPGVLLTEIANARADVHLTGIDPSADMIARAERNVESLTHRATVRVGTVTELPFPDRSFDLIVTSFSLHHWDDVAAAVPELARVLRPGGQLYVYDFARAPYELLDVAAQERQALDAKPAQHTVIRTGQLHIRRIVRHVLQAAPSR